MSGSKTEATRVMLAGLFGYGKEASVTASVWDSALFFAVLVVFYGLAFVLILFPAKVLRFHARLSRKGWANGAVPDWIDDLMDPLNKFLLGSGRAYLMQGDSEPERFPRMIWYFRILGLILFFGVTIPLLWAILTH